MKKLLFAIVLLISVSSYSQMQRYKVGKYLITLDTNNKLIKWGSSPTWTALLEYDSNEKKNVIAYQEIAKGKVVGFFEFYYINNGVEAGKYTRVPDRIVFDVTYITDASKK